MNQPLYTQAAASIDAELPRSQFARDVLAGLSTQQKHLSSKYFYDTRGSGLFSRITEVEEYYLTDCEFDIFRSYGTDIAAALAPGALDIVELGAGDGRKTKVLLSCLRGAGRRISYMPVDISASAIAALVDSVRGLHPDVETRGWVGEYGAALQFLESRSTRPRLVLFLGSSIGNLDFAAATDFLRTLATSLRDGDYLLAGFDLRKDIGVLTAAYNDSQGVTREFNLNVLRRINAELGGQFRLDRFCHHGFYNPASAAMESWLISLEEQHVPVAALGRTFHFDRFEGIHLECSCKYLEKDLALMASQAGFAELSRWQDSKGWFVDALWQVRKNP